MQEKDRLADVVMPSYLTPLVSICTVTYERQALLPLLEQSLILQDYPQANLEWIIIDDSPNGPTTFGFTDAIKSGVKVRYYYLEQRLELGAKRNLSHEYCRGEFIVYMDDDDYYPPTRVSHAVTALQNSECLIAGSSELPLLLLPECSTWMIHAFGSGHATGNTLAFHRSYLTNHAYEAGATHAEEAYFLDNFSVPMVQLEPLRTITCIGHSRNTVDKRRFLTSTHGEGISRVHTRKGHFVPEKFLLDYTQALAEIEDRHQHGILTKSLVANNEQTSATYSDDLKDSPRVAVITPYYNEDLAILKRCHHSVLAQTIPCCHFLVADGQGREELEALNCRHIRLGGMGHNDNGNTPRSIGALCAMNEGFTCIAYLDADNWFLPDHLESAIRVQRETGCEIVFTGREVAFPDGELLPQLDEEDLSRSHADTSSVVVFEPAFRSLSLWAQMPRELGPFCDRVAFNYLTSHFRCAWSDHSSVVFETWYWGHFTAAGHLPPANAKFLHARPLEEWQKVSDRFRHRSHTPFLPSSLPESPKKTRLNLISILGPVGCGAHRLQRDLCHHITFFGLPPNNFLYRWYQAFGGDCLDRHSSTTILNRLRQLEKRDKASRDWRLDPLIDAGLALSPNRTFTALEAYFRLVQATMPARCRSFSRINGVSNLIERSSSAAYAAQLLFELLPMHRALLVIGDPIDQITRLNSVAKAQALMSGIPCLTIEELCDQYLEALIQPLQAAPIGQLLIVRQEAFNQDPTGSLRHVADWLGLKTPEWPKGLKRRIDTLGAVNTVYMNELETIKQQVEQDIHLDERFSVQGSYAEWWGDLDAKMEVAKGGQATELQLSDADSHHVRSSFAPLLQLLEATALDEDPELTEPDLSLAEIAKSEDEFSPSRNTSHQKVLTLCKLLQDRWHDSEEHLFGIRNNQRQNG